MSDVNLPNENGATKCARTNCKKGSCLKLGLAALLIGVVGFCAGKYTSHQGMMGGYGAYQMRGEMQHGMNGARVERRIDKALNFVQASDEQRMKIKAIALSLKEDLMPLRESSRLAHKEALAALIGAQVDDGKLEALRKDRMSALDGASARVLKGIKEISAILTPEQRAKLGDKAKWWM